MSVPPGPTWCDVQSNMQNGVPFCGLATPVTSDFLATRSHVGTFRHTRIVLFRNEDIYRWWRVRPIAR